jgi:uncharacterized Rmd1/YagE family protein
VFYFEGGSVVCWNLSQSDVVSVLQEVKPFESKPLSNVQSESMEYAFTPSARTQMRGDLIYISNEMDARDTLQHQLAFSYGLHQSVKLAMLEEKISNQIKSAKDIQEHLVRKPGWFTDHQTSKVSGSSLISN